MSIFYGIIFVLLFVLYELAPDHIDASYISEILVLDVVLILSFFTFNLNKIDFRRNFLRHSIFFILGFCIVHFQYYLFYLWNGRIDTSLDIWVDESIVCKALSLSSIGLTSFMIGYQLFFDKTVQRIIPSRMYPTTCLVAFAYVIIALFLVTVNPAYLMGEYRTGIVGGVAIYFQLFFELLLSSIVISNSVALMSSSQKHLTFYQFLKKPGWAFLFLLSAYLLLLLFIGERSSIIFMLLLLAGSYGFYRKKWLNPIVGFVIVLVGAVVMSVIGEMRKYDRSIPYVDRIAYVLEDGDDYVIQTSTNELASSVRSLHYAVSYVPDQYEHTHGLFFLQQILSVVPWLGQFVYNNFDGSYQYKNSASFITYLHQGSSPKSGVGTSCIADLYLEFGLMGVIVGMFLFGMVIKKFELSAFCGRETSVLLWVFTLVYFARSVYIARSTVMLGLKECITIFAIITLNNFIHSVFSRK